MIPAILAFIVNIITCLLRGGQGPLEVCGCHCIVGFVPWYCIVLYCGYQIPIWYSTTGIVPLYYIVGIVGVTKSTFYLTPQFINRSRLAESSFYELPFACKIHFQVSVSIFAMGDESSVMIISDFREESESAELWMIGWGKRGAPTTH